MDETCDDTVFTLLLSQCEQAKISWDAMKGEKKINGVFSAERTQVKNRYYDLRAEVAKQTKLRKNAGKKATVAKSVVPDPNTGTGSQGEIRATHTVVAGIISKSIAEINHRDVSILSGTGERTSVSAPQNSVFVASTGSDNRSSGNVPAEHTSIKAAERPSFTSELVTTTHAERTSANLTSGTGERTSVSAPQSSVFVASTGTDNCSSGNPPAEHTAAERPSVTSEPLSASTTTRRAEPTSGNIALTGTSISNTNTAGDTSHMTPSERSSIRNPVEPEGGAAGHTTNIPTSEFPSVDSIQERPSERPSFSMADKRGSISKSSNGLRGTSVNTAHSAADKLPHSHRVNARTPSSDGSMHGPGGKRDQLSGDWMEVDEDDYTDNDALGEDDLEMYHPTSRVGGDVSSSSSSSDEEEEDSPARRNKLEIDYGSDSNGDDNDKGRGRDWGLEDESESEERLQGRWKAKARLTLTDSEVSSVLNEGDGKVKTRARDQDNGDSDMEVDNIIPGRNEPGADPRKITIHFPKNYLHFTYVYRHVDWKTYPALEISESWSASLRQLKVKQYEARAELSYARQQLEQLSQFAAELHRRVEIQELKVKETFNFMHVRVQPLIDICSNYQDQYLATANKIDAEVATLEGKLREKNLIPKLKKRLAKLEDTIWDVPDDEVAATREEVLELRRRLAEAQPQGKNTRKRKRTSGHSAAAPSLDAIAGDTKLYTIAQSGESDGEGEEERVRAGARAGSPTPARTKFWKLDDEGRQRMRDAAERSLAAYLKAETESARKAALAKFSSTTRCAAREVRDFFPEAAWTSKELAYRIHETTHKNYQCRRHGKARGPRHTHDTKDSFVGVGFPRILSTSDDVVTPKPGHMHCGCLIDDVLYEFYLWKTTATVSSNPSLEGAVFMGDGECPSPAIRSFWMSSIRNLSGLELDDFYGRVNNGEGKRRSDESWNITLILRSMVRLRQQLIEYGFSMSRITCDEPKDQKKLRRILDKYTTKDEQED